MVKIFLGKMANYPLDNDQDVERMYKKHLRYQILKEEIPNLPELNKSLNLMPKS